MLGLKKQTAVKFSVADELALRQLAEAEGRSFAGLVRYAALQYLALHRSPEATPAAALVSEPVTAPSAETLELMPKGSVKTTIQDPQPILSTTPLHGMRYSAADVQALTTGEGVDLFRNKGKKP